MQNSTAIPGTFFGWQSLLPCACLNTLVLQEKSNDGLGTEGQPQASIFIVFSLPRAWE